jgi:hypothetical protein
VAGTLDFISRLANAIATRFTLGAGLFARGLTDKGDGTVNANGLFVNGTAVVVASGGGGAAKGSVVGFDHMEDTTNLVAGNNIPLDNTPPLFNEGHQLMTLVYDPVASGNDIKVDVTVNCNGEVGQVAIAALFVNGSGSDSCVAAASGGHETAAGANNVVISFSHVVTAPSGAAITFMVRGGCDANNFTFNPYFGSKSASSIIVTEYQA